MLYEPILITEQAVKEETEKPTIYIETLTVNAPTTPKIRQELDPEVDKYLLEVFREAYSEAKLVAWCESRWNWKANRKGIDFGLFQINQIHFSEFPENKVEWIMDYRNNIDFAFKLYQEKKWGHWYKSYSCHKLL